jgi:hypothetical protein
MAGDEMMKRVDYPYQLSIYLKGEALDPSELTELLGAEATKSHEKGKKWFTTSQNEVVEKTGLWALVLQGDSGEDLSGLASRMKARLSHRSTSLDALPGVQEAYLDVLVMADADDDGGGTCEFALEKMAIADLNAIGLPIQFTIAVVVP